MTTDHPPVDLAEPIVPLAPELSGHITRLADGTAVISFGEVPVDVDENGLPTDPGGATFVAAWRIVRPTMGVLRHLNEIWWRGSATRETELRELNERAAAIREAISSDDSDVRETALASEDASLVRDVSERMVSTMETLVESWFPDVLRYLGRPIGEHPRAVTASDYPPWLSRGFGVYNALTTHWMALPLDRGAVSASGSLPTQTALRPRTTSDPAAPPAP